MSVSNQRSTQVKISNKPMFDFLWNGYLLQPKSGAVHVRGTAQANQNEY